MTNGIDLEHYEFEYDHLVENGDRAAHRQQSYIAGHTPKQSVGEIIESLVDVDDTLETGFETTYQPAKYERQWLADALGPFYVMGDITDVIRLVKGGKEASVYMCAANPSLGHEFLAAKVFRPRRFRSLRNDTLYRHGRAALESDGTQMRDRRGLHAIRKGTEAGKEMRQTSWLAHEFVALETLHTAGADVPAPVASGHNTILMSYIGDASMAAPTLNSENLGAGSARQLFEQVLWNIELMLSHEIVHGDLSAYNVLHWHDSATIIDLPQVVSPFENPAAEWIFRRDVRRICDYFVSQGVGCDSRAIADDLWHRHVPGNIWPLDPLPEELWDEPDDGEDDHGEHERLPL